MYGPLDMIPYSFLILIVLQIVIGYLATTATSEGDFMRILANLSIVILEEFHQFHRNLQSNYRWPDEKSFTVQHFGNCPKMSLHTCSAS